MKKLKLDELGRKSIDECKSVEKINVVAVLDNIRSMNNVGSFFRTADAFLISKLYLCGITATPPHREIHKTALGATDSVDWEHYPSTAELIQKLKADGYLIIGIEQTDASIELDKFEIKPDQKYALIFGNEVEGISNEAIALLDKAIEIPQQGTKHSLNVSVAAGIVMYRFFIGM